MVSWRITTTKLTGYIRTSLNFKKTFIEEDEFDRVRIPLNFAYTFGHAFEVSSNYAIPMDRQLHWG